MKENSLRIVFFSHYFPPEGNAPASRTYDHCVRWVKAGNEVVVITCAPNVPNGKAYEGYKNRLWPQHEEVDGIHVIRVWTYLAPNAGAFKRILNYLSYMVSALFAFVFFCRRPNLIISTTPQFFCGWAGIIASYLKWCKMILEVRDIWPESIVTVGALKKRLLIRCLEFLERWMYRLPNHVVSVGNGYKENILSKAKISKRISVVTNGVDPTIFRPLPQSTEFRKQHRMENKFVCSYVGTIGMAHGLEIVIRAAEELKRASRTEIVFCLVGDGAKRESLEGLVKQKNLEEWIRFTGRLPKERMPEILSSSDCLLIHLKKSDLFKTVIPSKIFESMAVERPLIMAVSGESAEIVQRSGAGVVIEPENENELLDAINKLSTDPQFYESLRASGRSFVTEHYTRDVLASKYLEIIQAVVKSG